MNQFTQEVPPPGQGARTTPPGGGETTGTVDKVKDQARDATGQAVGKAKEAAGRSGDRVRAEVDRRSTEGGERLRQMAGDMRSVGQGLRDQGKDTPARLADQAADRADRLGGYLREADADRILGDAEDFGRRQPWVVMLAGLAVGFAAARVLRASSAERYRGHAGGTSTPAWRPSESHPEVRPAGTPVSAAGGSDWGS